MFIFNFKSKKIFILLFRVILFLIFLLLSIISFDPIYCESESVFNKDGWSADPNQQTDHASLGNKISNIPWDIIILSLIVNSLAYFYFYPIGGPTYCDVGVQTDSLAEISKYLMDVSEAVSVMSVADSSIDTLSTILSGIPSIPNTEDLFPELPWGSDLGNALRAQELYNELLQNVDPSASYYSVYRVFLSHAKRIFFQALCDGLEPGTIEFSNYLNDTLMGNRPLINYLTHHGVNIQDIIG